MTSTSLYPNVSRPFGQQPSRYGSTSGPSVPTTVALSGTDSGVTVYTSEPTANTTAFDSAGKAIMPTSQIELTISCRNLLNMDTFSKSDPFAVVMTKNSWQDKFYEIGRTETIYDCLSPEWVKKFVLDYNFEIVQRIRFEFWDEDPGGAKDFLGCHETTLAEIVSFSSRQYIRPLTGMKQKKCGEVILVTEEVSTCKQIAQIQLAGEDLPSLICGLCRPDPFLVISRSNEDGTFSVVHKTEYVRSSANPLWHPIRARVRTLCNGDYDRTVKLECYDYRSNGAHVKIGGCFTTFRELIEKDARTKLNLEVIKSGSKTATTVGSITLRSIHVTEEITFLDYIKSGTQMHFAVAIDFTASNGAPHDPNSLHFLDPSGRRPNAYEIALRSVGEIIQQYDTKGMFPAFGFGAKLPPSVIVSHQFPLNGNSTDPYCTSMSEILTHYRNRLATVALFGPTNFSLVIKNTAAIAQQFQDGKHYFTLLIITDGIISDMYQTKNAIIDASTLPLSIIIVGVGNADFEAMDELDSDDSLLRAGSRVAKRDIVQFVPLNRFLSPGHSFVQSQADLAREVLAEIPEQMTGYMKSKGFTPGPIVETAF